MTRASVPRLHIAAADAGLARCAGLRPRRVVLPCCRSLGLLRAVVRLHAAALPDQLRKHASLTLDAQAGVARTQDPVRPSLRWKGCRSDNRPHAHAAPGAEISWYEPRGHALRPTVVFASYACSPRGAHRPAAAELGACSLCRVVQAGNGRNHIETEGGNRASALPRARRGTGQPSRHACPP